MTTPYEVLSVSVSANDETIKAAFRKAVKQHHPDLNPDSPGAERRLKRLIRARDLLLDRKRRRAYDSRHARRQAQLAGRKMGAIIAAGVLAATIVFFSHRLVKSDAPQVWQTAIRLDEFDMLETDAAAMRNMRDWREQSQSRRGEEPRPLSGRGRIAHHAVPAARMSRPPQLIRTAAGALKRLAIQLHVTASHWR